MTILKYPLLMLAEVFIENVCKFETVKTDLINLYKCIFKDFIKLFIFEQITRTFFFIYTSI